MTVIVSVEADDDHIRAIRHYDSKPGRFGMEVSLEYEKALKAIGESPRLYTPYEYGPPGVELRAYHVQRFDLIVLYEVREHDVLILSLVHANMPPEKWRTRGTVP